MIEKPILFSGEMVWAILDGRKTQTRRVVKPSPQLLAGHFKFTGDYGKDTWPEKNVWLALTPSGKFGLNDPPWYRSRYGVPGDRLWVRESFRVGAWRIQPTKIAFDYVASPEITNTEWCNPNTLAGGLQALKMIQQSIDECEDAMDRGDDRVWSAEKEYEWEAGNGPCRNRPSIHMPRWASRILLDVVDIRVERLRDISIEDAMREGVPYTELNNSRPDELHRGQFADLWDKINGKPRKDGVDISWAANPWVWVVEFRKVGD